MLERPEALNALNREMAAHLEKALERLEDVPALAQILLTVHDDAS